MTATPDLAGTPIPSVALHESSPGNKVDLAAELANKKGVIIGVPAAFSPACSSSHVPGFMNHPKVKDGSAGSVFVVAVNDAFVYVNYTYIVQWPDLPRLSSFQLINPVLQHEGLG